MPQATLFELYNLISGDLIDARPLLEILLLLNIVRKREALIKQQIEQLQFIDEKIMKSDFRELGPAKKKYWKLSPDQKVTVNRAIKIKRKNLLRTINFKRLLKLTDTYSRQYEQYLSENFDFIRKHEFQRDLGLLKDITRLDVLLQRIMQRAETAKRNYAAIIFETINNPR